MKIKDIIAICDKLLGLNLPDSYFTSEYADVRTQVEQNDSVNKLLTCVNLVLDSLYRYYVDEVRTATVTAENNVVNISELTGINNVLSLKDCYGYDVMFRYTSGGLKVNTNGKLCITYTVNPENATFDGTITLSDVRISPRIIAYGVAREYCQLEGDNDEAEVWDERYERGLRICTIKRCNAVLPPRRWV